MFYLTANEMQLAILTSYSRPPVMMLVYTYAALTTASDKPLNRPSRLTFYVSILLVYDFKICSPNQHIDVELNNVLYEITLKCV